MKINQIDEYISQEEYEQRSNTFPCQMHHLRFELSKKKVMQLKESTDAFITQWGAKLLNGHPEYWLTGGSTGEFTFEPAVKVMT
jgi:hypothetical protein